jgi:hypothetical protein
MTFRSADIRRYAIQSGIPIAPTKKIVVRDNGCRRQLSAGSRRLARTGSRSRRCPALAEAPRAHEVCGSAGQPNRQVLPLLAHCLILGISKMLIVICKDKTGYEWLPERRRIDTSWDATVSDIARGEFKDVSQVIHASMGKDVLDIIAREVMDIWADREEPLSDWQREFVQLNVSVQAANRFLQAAE